MKIKNKKITKKQWYLKQIKEYLERHILLEESDEYYPLEKYLEYTGKREFLIDYIKSDLEEELMDDLTCINGVGGKQDKQIGMIEFINLFINANLTPNDFIIEEGDYCFKVYGILNFCENGNDNYKSYEYLSDFFGDFLKLKAERILDEVENVE